MLIYINKNDKVFHIIAEENFNPNHEKYETLCHYIIDSTVRDKITTLSVSGMITGTCKKCNNYLQQYSSLLLNDKDPRYTYDTKYMLYDTLFFNKENLVGFKVKYEKFLCKRKSKFIIRLIKNGNNK